MNPLIYRKGVCDPHIHIFEGKAYLYATHDAPGYTDQFCMEDWQIWSSDDLIDWKLERTVYPEEFYCGRLDQCWAVDAAYKDGKYYLYFSTGDWGVGVGVSEHPAGPFRDALGHALADQHTYPEGIPKWDPHVFQDENGESYLIVGTCKQDQPWDCYLIARLKDDMIHLAEPFRRVEYRKNPCPEDKPSIHKHGGKYYLTHASYYAVADNVYGPYEHMGHFGFTNDHGAFFEWNGQTFFAAGGMDNANRYLRASYAAVCHYRRSGEIVTDPEIAAYGCGQYSAAWERIYAKWYTGAWKASKIETQDGRFCVQMEDGGLLYFPETAYIEQDSPFCVSVLSGSPDAVLEIYEGSPDGTLLGVCDLGSGQSVETAEERQCGVEACEGERICRCQLSCTAGKKTLYFRMKGRAVIEWFSFAGAGRKSVLEPVFSKRGRGSALVCDRRSGMRRVLANLELKGAGLEADVDAGCADSGKVSVYYECREEAVEMSLTINGRKYRDLVFQPGREVVTADVKLKPGLNRIGLWSQSYQKGKLAVSHVILETERGASRTYPAAGGLISPEGNGIWDGQPQWETVLDAYSGRMVKYLEKPGDSVTIRNVDGGKGGMAAVEIHYCRGEEGASEYEFLVNGKRTGKIAFPYTGGFSTDSMKEEKIEISLEVGEQNTLCLRKTGKEDKGIFVDAFSVLVYDDRKR